MLERGTLNELVNQPSNKTVFKQRECESMKSIGTKKPCPTTNQMQGFMCQTLGKYYDFNEYTAKSFKPKQSTFNSW